MPQVGASHEQLVLAAQSLALKDELMEKRRADRAEHQHKQIWTKDPHGGAYRKVLIRMLLSIGRMQIVALVAMPSSLLYCSGVSQVSSK